MKFHKTELNGCYLIEPPKVNDERGYLTRTYCRELFAKQQINDNFVQSNSVYTEKKGTLRGMHYAALPSAESKLIRCSKGRVFDVIVDLRPDSKTFSSWQGFELSEENRSLLYVPPLIAHGYISLVDDSEMFYQMGDYYDAKRARGIRWDDPEIKIEWPMKPLLISDRDRTLPVLSELNLA